SWAKADEVFGPERLRPRIEPWLTALCQSEHLSLLLGSGLGHAVYQMATNKALPGMATANFGDEQENIKAAANKSAVAAGRGVGNLEDQFRAATELLRGLEIIAVSNNEAKAKAEALAKTIADVLTAFAEGVLESEKGVLAAQNEDRE